MFWENFRRIIAFLLGIAFIGVGVQHFIDPVKFDEIVPSYLGSPRFWTFFSGFIEIVLGLGLFFKGTLKKASFFLVVFLILVYLANLNMWINDIPFNGTLLDLKGHVFRLLAQLFLILFFIGVVKWQK